MTIEKAEMIIAAIATFLFIIIYCIGGFDGLPKGPKGLSGCGGRSICGTSS